MIGATPPASASGPRPRPGLLDLVSSTGPASMDDLRSVTINAGRPDLVPRGGSSVRVTGYGVARAWRVPCDRASVLDAGTGPAWDAAAVPRARSPLMIRNS